LWGLLNGLVYYLLVCIVSALTGGMTESGFTIQMTTVLMCLGGGMLGGMLA
jgi:putative membrane protein (TIGR04086 family)